MAVGRKAGKSGRAVRAAGARQDSRKGIAQDRERAGCWQHADPDNQRRKSRERGCLGQPKYLTCPVKRCRCGEDRNHGGRVLIENHAGILEYSPSEIDVNSSGAIIWIQGDGLRSATYTQSELSIRGLVLSAEFIYSYIRLKSEMGDPMLSVVNFQRLPGSRS